MSNISCFFTLILSTIWWWPRSIWIIESITSRLCVLKKKQRRKIIELNQIATPKMGSGEKVTRRIYAKQLVDFWCSMWLFDLMFRSASFSFVRSWFETILDCIIDSLAIVLVKLFIVTQFEIWFCALDSKSRWIVRVRAVEFAFKSILRLPQLWASECESKCILSRSY